MKTQQRQQHQQQQQHRMRALLASPLLRLLLVLLMAAVVPTVTAAASFVAQVKGQKNASANTDTAPNHGRANNVVISRAPILQLQAVAKTASSSSGDAEKKKKTMATKTPTTGEATPAKATAAAAAKAPPSVVETVRKGEFIDRLVAVLAEEENVSSFTKKQVEVALAAVLQVIQEEVANGKKVMLPGFGSFVAKDRAARKGRNPQTGDEIDIPASRSPGFTPSKSWKDTLNGK